MPRVPDLNPVQADTRPLTGFRADPSVDNPNLAAMPGQQNQQMGAALLGAGDAAMRIATDMQERINQTQVDDALNTMRQTTLDLTYHPETGYQAIKGKDALQREGGTSLADEYSQKLRDAADKLTENLGNDAQRRQFALRANDISTSFKGNIEAHALQEFKGYSLSVQDGAIKLGQDEAKRNWADPVKIDTNIKSVQTAVVNAGRLQGKSANQVLAEMKTATSMVHLGVIDAALQNSNPTYAQQYLQKYSEQMTADDILKVNGAINQDLDGRIAQQAVSQTSQVMAPKFQPSNLDRMFGITVESESNGNPNAVSPKGAKGLMQVMDGTNKDPGFGVKPAKDNSPEERVRVGQDYLNAMVQKYGNPAMAWAAYNAGPGTLDDAMKKADGAGTPQNWLSYMPKETQDYVKKNMDKLGAGMGGSPMPTELEFVNDAIARLGPNARPQQVKLARAAAEHQFNIISKSFKEQGDQVVAKAQQALITNGGDVNSLPRDLKTALAQYAPAKMDDLLAFGTKIRKGQPVETDWGLYYQLKTDHALLGAANLMSLRDKLGETEFKSLTEEQQSVRQGKADVTTRLRSTTDVVNQMMREVGIDPTPKDSDKAGAIKVGRVWAAIDERVREAERVNGRPLKTDEVGKLAASLFASVNVGSSWWSNNTPAVLVDPGQELVVPKADRQQITDALRAAKKPVTDDAIQAIYRRSKGIR